MEVSYGVTGTLRAEMGGHQPLVMAGNIPECYAIDHVVTSGGNCTAQGPCYYKEKRPTLKASGPHSVSYCIAGNMVDRETKQHGLGVSEEIASTLTAADRHAVMSTTGGQIIYSSSKASYHTIFQKDKAPTLIATDWKDAPTVVTVTEDK